MADSAASAARGWADAECDVLSRRLYDYADADFSGDVSSEEVLAVLSRLGQELEVAKEEIQRLPAVSPEPSAEERRRLWSEALQQLCAKAGVAKFKQKVRQLLQGPPPGDARIILGPVIGKVTESSARILVEASHDVEISCTCKAEGSNSELIRATSTLTRRRPSVLKLEGLAPSALYTVEFQGAELLVDRCSFRTLPADGWRLGEGRSPCFAIASCNCVYETRKRGDLQKDLWEDLKTRLEEGLPVDYMLHLGDNVYLDSDWHLIEKGKKALEDDCKWGVARAWLLDLDRSKWSEHESEIEEHFRNVYRETWGHRPTRWVLANVPNLMILDDHDIRDDWGDRPEDKELESIDRFLAEIAYRVLNSYQRLLHEDPQQPDWTLQKPDFDYHMHVFGDVAFLFVDVRGCKTFHWKEEEDTAAPMLGQAQWAAIEAALKPGGSLAACKAILVMVPEPIGYVSRAFTQILGNTVCDDLLGQWSAEAHRAEVPRFLKLLKAWRDSQSGNQVLLVAGDVHEGGWTDLILDDVEGEGRIRQLTTSAIANKQTKAHEAMAVSMTRGVLSSLDVSETGSGWVSRHYDWTNQNNYALVKIHMAFSGVLKVRVLKAEGLKNEDMLSYMDPYVNVSVGNKTETTGVVCDASCPEWNEEFSFTVKPSDLYFKLHVADEDSFMGQDLGKVKLPIHDLDASPRTIRESLGENKGVIQIEASFHRSFDSAAGPADGEEASGPTASSTADAQAVITAQLVTSGQETGVTTTKLRGTGDPVFSTSKKMQHQAQECAGFAGQVAQQVFGGCIFRK